MHPSFVFRGAVALAAAVLFASACSDSSGPKPRRATDIEVVTGEDQVGEAGGQLPNPIVVAALDEDGLPVPDQSVTFVVVAGGGTVDVASARTNAVGLAQVRWTLGPSMNAEQRLEARLAGNGSTAMVSVLATAGPAAPATLTIVPPGTNGSVYPGVSVVDRFGNPVPGVTVTFDVTAGGGTLVGATQTTNALGVATVERWNLGAPGANTIRASSGTLTPVTYTIMQLDRTPARVILSAGQNQTAEVGSNVPIPLAVIVQNEAGIALSDVVVTFTPAPNNGNVSTATVTTGMNGMATLGGWTLGPVAGTQTLVASASETATFTFTATATPARVGRLEKHAGDAQIALVGTAVATPPAVKVLDVYGNAVPGVAVTFSVYNGLGSITGAEAVSDANGIATVGSWTLGPFAGTQTLRATAVNGTVDVDITATATTGMAVAINPHPDNPTSALLRTEVTLSVIVVDDIGNPKAGIPVSFAPITSHFGQGSVLAPSQNINTSAQGVASVRYVMPDNVYAAGGVYASSPDLSTLQMNVSPVVGPAERIVVTLPSDAVNAGAELGRPVFSVVDADDNPIPFYPVTFTVTTGGGTVDGVVETTVSTAPPPATTATGPLWISGPFAGVNTIVLAAEGVPSVTVTRTTISPP